MVLFLLLPDRDMKGFFLDIYWENLAKLLEVKLTKVWGPSYDWVTWSFKLSYLSTQSLQKFVNYSSHFLTKVLVPTAVPAQQSLLW